MRASNLKAIGYWNELLKSGLKIPACGGSDYHRSQLFLFPGGPTTCIYSRSSGAADILAALKAGHAYIISAPDGPSLEMTAGNATLGDSVLFSQVKVLLVTAKGLHAGDLIQVVTAQGNVPLLKSESDGDFQCQYTMSSPGFARLEILREVAPGFSLPLLPVLVSNPIYFDADS